MNKIIRNFIITLTLVGLMIFTIFNIKILPNAKPLFKIGFFNSNYLNETFVYQVTTLLLSFVIILITALQTKFQAISLLSITKIDGNINPEPWIGITKNNKDTWKKLGINLAVYYIYCHGYYSLFSSVPQRKYSRLPSKFFTRCSICSYKLLCRRSNIPPYFCKHSRVPQTKPLYFARAFGNYIRLCPLLWRTGKNTRRVIGRISRLAFVKNHP